jgi:site-specific DNA-methyltransferase (adenine-specific)
MKPVDGNFVQNAQKWGVAGLAIDACRIPTGDCLGSFGGGIISWHRLNHKHGRLSDEAMERVEQKPRGWIDNSTGKGRWPANLILSHHHDCTSASCSLDCPLRILDAQSGPMKSNLTVVSGRGGTGNVYALPKKTPSLHGYIDSGGASRFFWTAKASRSERKQFNVHPTVKPVALMQYLVKLILPPDGGIILDPFLGSGTTAVACQSIGVEFLGIELDPKYVNIARARLLQEKPKFESAKEEPQPEGVEQGGLFD